jgi:hypothetical protein
MSLCLGADSLMRETITKLPGQEQHPADPLGGSLRNEQEGLAKQNGEVLSRGASIHEEAGPPGPQGQCYPFFQSAGRVWRG